ncbi:MAG: SUMF1/EgtB/PvdO family nonheme iron enzyme [Planctomycetes bacterium]|nr:SUMF1/EgtB/PvdO family nonheme iron enzyme [Planctomycetota bacterium]
MSPADPSPTPDSLFADFLARHDGAEQAEFERFVREHAQHERALRALHGQFLALEGVLRLSGLLRRDDESARSFAARLSQRYGKELDPEISLGEAGSGAPSGRSSEFVERLSKHAHERTRYRLEGEIARGGMGAILKVWDEDLRRDLAMKVILSQRERTGEGSKSEVDENRLARFLEEAQITGQLDHPGIVPVHELGLDGDGRVYFTMKLVKGRDLKHVFERVFAGDPEWTETRALSIVLRVCEAMAYAHKKGVIHRDLKPANVMVGSFGEVYVMDWGLARVVGRKDSHDIRLRTDFTVSVKSVKTERRDEREDTPDSPLITMDGDVMGTPAYMPPEQARGDIEKLGARADVYALGAMLYHLLARQMPYVPPLARLTNRTVLGLVQQGAPTPIAELRKDVPPELAAICEKAMARAMEARYADTLELASDLRAFLEGRVVKAYRTGAVVELTKWVKRNRPLAASLAGGVLVAIGGLAAVVVSQRRAAEAESEKARKTELLTLAARVDGLAEEAERLWPLTNVELLPALEEWTRSAAELTRPETLAAVQHELEEVRRQGRQRAPEELKRLLEADPRQRDVTAKRQRVEFRSIVLARWQSGDPPEPESMRAAPDWALFPTEPLRLNELAWKLVGFDRDSDGNEPLALKLVERGLETAPAETVIELEDTLAWALFRNGRADDARDLAEKLKRDAEKCEAGRRAAVLGSVAKLEDELKRVNRKGFATSYQADTDKLAEEAATLQRELEAEWEWAFDSVVARTQYRYFAKLPAALESLSSGTRARSKLGLSVPERAEWARTLAEKTISGPSARAAWERAITSIRDRKLCPKYDGLVIEPQLGLLPLERDAQSGLWEFLYPITGDAPARGTDGRLVIEDKTGVVLVLIPGGKFRMGAQSTDPSGDRHFPEAEPDESPVATIELAPYFLAKHELTQGQWTRVVLRNPSFLKAGLVRGGTTVDLSHPIEGITWNDANKWLARMGLALPTEAQWECAARAGQEDTVYTGDAEDALDGAANVRDQTLQADDKLGGTDQPFAMNVKDDYVIHAPVGRFRPNDYGLFDTQGNLWEWCRDLAGPYNQTPLAGDGERTPYGMTNRVLRGGSFLEDAAENRLSRRNEDHPGYRSLNVGVRAARAVSGKVGREPK